MLNVLLTFVVVLATLVLVVSHKGEKAHAALALQVRGEFHRKAQQAFASKDPVNHLRKGTLSYSATGFIYGNVAFDYKCHDPVFSVGFPVNLCAANDGFYFKFQVADGEDSCAGAIIEYYGDTECTDLLGTSPVSDGHFACARVENPFIGERRNFVEFSCTNYATPKLSFDSAVTEYYANTTSCGEDSAVSMEYYTTMSTGFCFDYPDGSSLEVKCDGSVVTNDFHPEPHCKGAPFPFELPTECEVSPYGTDDDGADDDGLELDLLHPPPSVSSTPFPSSVQETMANGSTLSYCAIANAPSARPTFAPTRLPTAATEAKVAFKVTQTIKGFSIEAYNMDVGRYDKVFMESIAATMDGVKPEQVTELKVTPSEPPARRALLGTTVAARPAENGAGAVASAKAAGGVAAGVADSVASGGAATAGIASVSRRLAEGAVDLTYVVRLSTGLAAESLIDQLTAAVEDGSFNALLQQSAERNGALGLDGAHSDSIEAVVVDESDDDETAVLSTGAIIGIAVGGFVALVLIVGAVVMLCLRGKTAAVAIDK